MGQVTKGMWVEHQNGLGRILVIDEQEQVALVESHSDHEQYAVPIEELEEQLQMHNGCDRYY